MREAWEGRRQTSKIYTGRRNKKDGSFSGVNHTTGTGQAGNKNTDDTSSYRTCTWYRTRNFLFSFFLFFPFGGPGGPPHKIRLQGKFSIVVAPLRVHFPVVAGGGSVWSSCSTENTPKTYGSSSRTRTALITGTSVRLLLVLIVMLLILRISWIWFRDARKLSCCGASYLYCWHIFFFSLIDYQ
jgi:hypothetical protein